MAEGWAHHLLAQKIEALSAGTAPAPLNPLAVRVMQEVGIDISHQRSKHLDSIPRPIDCVITVCDSARDACPQLPGVPTLHAPFPDPPELASRARSEDEALAHYRAVRDQIRDFVASLADSPSPLPVHPTPEPAPMPANPARSCCSSDCCTPNPQPMPQPAHHADTLRSQVRDGYAAIAQSGSWSTLQSIVGASPAKACCNSSVPAQGGGCCGPATFTPAQLAEAIGYSSGELSAAPEGANMGLSCGNPTAIASLRPGEVVLDLGSGGGFDCFIAGPKVGASGRVIGVDMTPDTLTRARRNTPTYSRQTGLSNVEFRLGEIEHLPVADASVDVVISNCVLNLSPDKPQVWREIARVLKPGGRVAVSDLALLRPLPDAVRADLEALIGCIAGAALIDETRSQMAAAGLADIQVVSKPQYVAALTDWNDPLYRKIAESLPPGTAVADFITSADITARRQPSGFMNSPVASLG